MKGEKTSYDEKPSPRREAKQNTQNKGHLRPIESALEQKGLETTQTNLSSKCKQLGKEAMIFLAL